MMITALAMKPVSSILILGLSNAKNSQSVTQLLVAYMISVCDKLAYLLWCYWLVPQRYYVVHSNNTLEEAERSHDCDKPLSYIVLS